MAQGIHFWLSHRRAQREVAPCGARDATQHPPNAHNEHDLAKTVNSAEVEKFCSKAKGVDVHTHEKHLILGL